MSFVSRISLSLVASVLAGSALAADPQPSTQEMKEYLGRVAALFAHIKPTPGPVAEERAPSRLTRDFSFEQARQGLSRWQSSFYFRAWSDNSKLLLVESDPYHVPGGDLATAKIVWTSAVAGDGKNLLDPDHNQPEGDLSELGHVAQTKAAVLGAAGAVRRLEGLLTVHYPTGMGGAEFLFGDPAKEKRLRTITCRPLEWDNDVVAITCDAWGKGLVPVPVSAGGTVLDVVEMAPGPYAVYRAVKQSGGIPDAMMDRLAVSDAEANKEGVVFVVKAKGKIAKLVAMEVAGWQDETFKIDARRMPDFNGSECPEIPRPRYAPVSAPAAYATVDETTIQAGTTILSAREEEASAFNAHLVRIQLPHLANSLWATAEVLDFALLTGAKPVNFFAEGPVRDDTGYGFWYRMTTNARKPINTMKGTVELRYPTTIATRKVTAGQKDPAVSISGCGVGIVGDTVRVDVNAVYPSVRAFAADGMPLKVAGTYGFPGQPENGFPGGLYFWGAVAAVEVDEVREWKTVVFPLNLKPAPALRRR